MKILIFGGNGFLGSEIALLLQSKKIEYYTVSRSKSTCNFKIDISNFDDFKKLPNNFFDVVINCATMLPGGHYLDNAYLDKIYSTNILGSQNICKWIDNQKSVKKIVNCSTLVVANKPWNLNINEETNTYPTGNHVLYSGSKLMQELIFATFAKYKKLDLVQLRFSTLYGKLMPWNGIICDFIDQAKNNNAIQLSNGSQVSADFLNVIDAAKITIASIESDIEGIVNAASGKETSLLELANFITEIINKNIEINNSESDNFIDNRSVININKLATIINTNDFIDIKNGIKQILQS